MFSVIYCTKRLPYETFYPMIPIRRKIPESTSLRKMCSYSEFFWSVFSHINPGDESWQRNSPFLVEMKEKTIQKNFEYGKLSRSALLSHLHLKILEWTLFGSVDTWNWKRWQEHASRKWHVWQFWCNKNEKNQLLGISCPELDFFA